MLMCILYIPSVQRQRTKIFPAIRCTMRKFRHLCIKDLYMERSSIPEKSGSVGLGLLERFADLAKIQEEER